MARSTRLILLAAGQGARLMPLTADIPKAMQPISGEPLLLRTMRLLSPIGFADTTVVVGYRRTQVAEAIRRVYPAAHVVENVDYEQDTNIWSTLLGIGDRRDPALIFEADVVVSEECVPGISEAIRGDDSVWFTHGPFHPPQLGGILRSDEDRRVMDLRYTPRFEERFRDYKKLLGLLFVGPREMNDFTDILRESAALSKRQYYMTPWCENLAALPCRECDLAPAPAGTFNTIEEYRRCCEVFAS